MAEGIQSAKTWWKGTTLSKNLNKAASSVTKAWKNSSIGQFCNKAKNTVTNFYEKHKTAINLVAGAAIIGVCGVAMLATGPLGCCMAAVAAKGAFFGAVEGGISSAVSYMQEHGTLDGAGKQIMEGVATGFSSGAFSGAVSGAMGGAAAYKKNPTGYCFVAGTFVLTTLGYAGIECIRAGDYVYAKDEETGEQEYMPVLETFTNEVTEICTLTIDGEAIETTVGHKFYTVENGWMSAGDLSEGDTVELSDGSNGTVESVEITELDEPVTVYNFCVMDFHTYYVGENEVLVHNKCTVSVADDVSGGGSASKAVDTNGKRYTPDQQAVVELAKEAKKAGGATLDDANILMDWAKEYNVPAHGPEIHPDRPGAASNILHFHIGKTGHIPIIDN